MVKTVENAGVNVVYGEKDTFDPTETNFSSIVTAIKASNPDAVLVIAFDQSKSIFKELASQGVDTHKLYMTDGNTAATTKGGDNKPATVSANLMAVSGANGGTECTSYKDCVTALKAGKDIKYKAQSGIGPFNDDHDPGTASIGVYKFDGSNKPNFDHAQEGAVPKK